MALKTIPTKAIENVILTTLLTDGGTSKSTSVYTAVSAQFPRLTRACTKNLPYNVRWARMSLATRGLVADSKVRGEWTLTAKGRKAARTILFS